MKTTIKNRFPLSALFAAFGLILADRATAQTFTSLNSFASTPPFTNNNGDGAYPQAGLITNLSGTTLYGTAYQGGSPGNGTVFAVNTDGTGLVILHSFTETRTNSSGAYTNSDGANPVGGLFISGDTLYGTTFYGGSSGYGTVFAVNTDGTGFRNLHHFIYSEGAYPAAKLVLSGKTLYGTAIQGGSSGHGVGFAVDTDGTGFRSVSFSGGTDGASPYAGFIFSGNIMYGTAYQGGSSGNGTAFAVDTNGAGFRLLHTFTATRTNSSGVYTNSDGASPHAGLILSGNTFYGTAVRGGTSGYGTVFKVKTDGTGFTNMHNFTGLSDGANPLAGLILSGNTLYGTASQGGSSDHGTVFAINTNGASFRILHSFTGGSDGANPYAGLILSGTTLYGTAVYGGSSDDGAVFAINTDGTGFTTLHSFTPLSQALGFRTTGALTSVRAGHSATLLPDGTVLVVGGFNGTIRLATSELYDPAIGAWTASGKMAIGRTLHTATLLSNGRVLVTGGHFTATGSSPTCELYDPDFGTWAETGAMATARGNHTATLLLNRKVLVAGGFKRDTGSALSTAELYDPGTGTWRAVGSLASARVNHTATLLPNGKVLVAGGAPDNLQSTSLSTVEVYDPDTGIWTTKNPMSSARQAHTSTLLPDGRVLVAGGFNVGYFTSSAEIYDPASGTWMATGALGTSRGVHSATLLPDGKVLAVGGNHNSLDAPPAVALFSAELYDPATGTWTTASRSLNTTRSTHTATLLPSGQVLIAAGYYVNNNVQLSSAELYGSTAGPITLVHPKRLRGGFQFAFTGVPNGTNTILATTNLALQSSDWMELGVVAEFAPGLFLFTDPQVTNHSLRVYRLRSP
jgi:uncharacterized repeat protein (TIGR03803 family)